MGARDEDPRRRAERPPQAVRRIRDGRNSAPGTRARPWLTFAIAGSGPTGVELAGQIREMATRALAHEFHSIEPQDARVLLFDGGSCVLGSFAPALTDKATKILQNLGVELQWVCTSPTCDTTA